MTHLQPPSQQVAVWGSGPRARTEAQCERSNPSSLLILCVALGGHLPSLSFSFLPCRSELSMPSVGVAMNGPAALVVPVPVTSCVS